MILDKDGKVASVSDLAHWLRLSLLPGTGRPPRPSGGLTAAARAVLDAQARAEREERAAFALGTSPAPYDLDVAELLEQAPCGDEDPAAFAWSLRAASVLGLLVDGQLLDAWCPWCEGRSELAPVGGVRSLRVRVLVDGRPAVVCEASCEPSSADVGVWHRGRPAWPVEAEGGWLAGRIEAADEHRRLAAVQVGVMLERESVVSGCPVCGGVPVQGQAGCCSVGHRKRVERRSQRERRRAGEAA